MSVLLQKGLKQMLLKHCDFIVSSLEVGGCCGNARPTNVRREDIFGCFIVDFR